MLSTVGAAGTVGSIALAIMLLAVLGALSTSVIARLVRARVGSTAPTVSTLRLGAFGGALTALVTALPVARILLADVPGRIDTPGVLLIAVIVGVPTSIVVAWLVNGPFLYNQSRGRPRDDSGPDS